MGGDHAAKPRNEMNTNESKHTPGPWKSGLIKSPMGNYDWQVRGGNGYLVLQVSEGTVPGYYDKVLLEAAPELLGLLVEAVRLADAGGRVMPSDTLRAARGAIAKARGMEGGSL